jgi:mono/diheme cytochrome c family protein
MSFGLAKRNGNIYDYGMIIRIMLFSFFAITGIFATDAALGDVVVTSQPVYTPDYSHEGDHLAETTLQWDATMKSTTVTEGADAAHFVFNFTNVSGTNVTILDIHPSCGCTSAEHPSLPWFLPPGTNSQISVSVNLAGKYGTITKTVRIGTDHGSRDLIVEITITPQTMRSPTDAERIQQMQVAKADRQAVFKNDCATCHEKQGEFKYGKALYDADCAICHEALHRASMVPDLNALAVPTNDDFWQTWIKHGKPGTFMPAFSSADGGPLNDMQIASVAAYLDYAMPSKVPQKR